MPAAGLSLGEELKLSVRPEMITLSAAGGTASDGSLAGVVKDRAFIGNRIVYWVTLADGETLRCQEARTVAGMRFNAGAPVVASWPSEANVVLKG